MIAADEALILDRMAIGGAAAARPSWAGSRRTRVRGAGIEFHDYRPYQPGDDPRSIDWTAEARLRQLVVRVSRAEGNARLYILVDISASMAIGRPAKLACARKLAAALAYVAIARRDTAAVATFDTAIRHHIAPAAGWPQLARVLSVLNGIRPEGTSALDDALLSFGGAVRGPGLVVVLSDFLEPDQGLAGCHYLQHQGLTPAIVQVLAGEELDPQLADQTELFDIERPLDPPMVVDQGAEETYRRRLDEHCAALRDLCLSRGLPWARLSSAMPFRQQLTQLEQARLLVVHGS